MPSSSPTNKRESAESGTLFVVASPLGNPDDITLRALDTLRAADLVAAEDTRETGRMLARHHIRQRLVSYHEHNEVRRTGELLDRLRSGAAVALVSDAGTPGISDPGYRLVTAAVREGIRVVPVPGVSAATAALCVAGLPMDAFLFAGFPPKKTGRRRAVLEQLAGLPFTIIFFESPLRILNLLEDLRKFVGDRQCVLAREMTKPHEEFIRGRIGEVLAELGERRQIKGECTLLVAGDSGVIDASWRDVQEDIRLRIAGNSGSPSDLARAVSEKFGVPRRKAYDEILRQKEHQENAESTGASTAKRTKIATKRNDRK